MDRQMSSTIAMTLPPLLLWLLPPLLTVGDHV
jgi:hypothetical protein